jgi:predicted Zn-dependent peptidase
MIPYHNTLDKTIHIDSDNKQTYVSFYFRSVPYTSKWTYHMGVISYMLTGNLNSLLNNVLRKQLGATYSVSSFQTLYHDTGYFTITFSCNREKVQLCIDNTLKVLDDIKIGNIDKTYLNIVKNKKETSNMFAFENLANYFDFVVESLLTNFPISDPQKVMKRYSSITVEELQILAKKIFCKEN